MLCIMFAGDLMKKVNIQCEIEFVKLSSYHGTESTGKIKEQATNVVCSFISINIYELISVKYLWK